ncbi:phosphodiester glycosidase family protein [Cohnella sp. LGH]|uniref:phosphodiester glycosidase family protein n=1 Tax=Cohnella sp. LGH TaxID=1619153 RepID=UPI0021120475|nr:phosphodiester glycosidase family protein [Cohnella sp. LGH]
MASEAEGVGGTADKRPRTMMGYIPSTEQVVLAIAVDNANRNNANYGITFYDARTIMKDLGCTMAIHLDGGSSTSIRLRDQPQDGPEVVIRHKVTDNAQQVTAYFDTIWFQQYSPSQWTDL